MPRAHPKYKNFYIEECNGFPPFGILSESDIKKGLKYPHEKNKRYYRVCLELNDDYKNNEAIIRWFTLGYVIISDTR